MIQFKSTIPQLSLELLISKTLRELAVFINHVWTSDMLLRISFEFRIDLLPKLPERQNARISDKMQYSDRSAWEPNGHTITNIRG